MVTIRPITALLAAVLFTLGLVTASCDQTPGADGDPETARDTLAKQLEDRADVTQATVIADTTTGITNDSDLLVGVTTTISPDDTAGLEQAYRDIAQQIWESDYSSITGLVLTVDSADDTDTQISIDAEQAFGAGTNLMMPQDLEANLGPRPNGN